MNTDTIREAAAVIRAADALLITAGAGMGVDSGLPDFRGAEGFWNAYPPYAKLGLNFADLANPEWFEKDPELAWGFYGHRLNLYRATIPHAGYSILLNWARAKRDGAHVFTSNVDGAFQAAQFPPDHVTEVHGNIHWMQCVKRCGIGIFSGEKLRPSVNESTFRARPPLPTCPACGALARPNILMFGDYEWESSRSRMAGDKSNAWLRQLRNGTVAVVECGAGVSIPTVRFFSENVAHIKKGRLIRINTHDPDVPDGHISIQAGALAALTAIDTQMNSK